MKERDTPVTHEHNRAETSCEQFAFVKAPALFFRLYLAMLICHNVSDTFASMHTDTTCTQKWGREHEAGTDG